MHEMWFYDRSIKWRLVGVRIVLVIGMLCVCVREGERKNMVNKLL